MFRDSIWLSSSVQSTVHDISTLRRAMFPFVDLMILLGSLLAVVLIVDISIECRLEGKIVGFTVFVPHQANIL